MSRPIRILVANGPEEVNGVTWWRMYRPLQYLYRQFPDIEIVYNETGMLRPCHFIHTDIVIIWRPCLQNHLITLKMAKQWGCRIIIDHDDDLYNIPISSPDFEYFSGLKPIVNACIAMADQVWVSTPALATLYGHPNTVVIPNAVLPDDLPDEPNKHSGTMVWRGSAAHRDDLEVGKASYPSLLRAAKRLLFIGYAPTWAISNGNQVEYSPPVAIQDYFSFLRAQKPLAIWKPLVSNPFNDGKSNISWIEATCAGGILVSNYAGKPGWEHAMRELPKTEAVRREVWQVSRDVIVSNYNLLAWNMVRYREILKHGTS